MVQESRMMVPHCVRKLITATADLESVLDTIPDTAAGEEEEETEDMKLIRKAKDKLEEARLVVKEEELDDENTSSTQKSNEIEETAGVKQNNMTGMVTLA